MFDSLSYSLRQYLPQLSTLIAILLGLIGLISTVAAGTGSSTTPTNPSTPSTPAPTTTTAAPASPVADSYAALATLEIKGRAPKTGYSRDLFGTRWSDDVDNEYGHNGCDTRNDILNRDLVDKTFKPGTNDCVVLTGLLHDPYTGKDINFQRGQSTSSAVQIDHIVPLSDAWQKGAQQWDEAKRRNFANDPRNLLAVDGPANASKSDSDAATWLPSNKAYRCTYAQKIIAVKDAYDVWVTQAEHDALESLLASCPAA